MQLASCHWAYDQYISTQWHIYTLFTIVILIFRLYLHIYILQITPPSCSWYNNILACITELHIVTYISFLYIFFILPGSNIIGSGVPNLKIAIVGMLFWIFYNFIIALIINIYLYVTWSLFVYLITDLSVWINEVSKLAFTCIINICIF